MQNQPSDPSSLPQHLPFLGSLLKLKPLVPTWEVNVTLTNPQVPEASGAEASFKLPLDNCHPRFQSVRQRYTLYYPARGELDNALTVQTNQRAELALQESLLMLLPVLGASVSQVQLFNGFPYVTLTANDDTSSARMDLQPVLHKDFTGRQMRIALLVDALRVAWLARAGVIDQGVTPSVTPAQPPINQGDQGDRSGDHL